MKQEARATNTLSQAPDECLPSSNATVSQSDAKVSTELFLLLIMVTNKNTNCHRVNGKKQFCLIS